MNKEHEPRAREGLTFMPGSVDGIAPEEPPALDEVARRLQPYPLAYAFFLESLSDEEFVTMFDELPQDEESGSICVKK